jgi:alpha-L-arabinofuranosidase
VLTKTRGGLALDEISVFPHKTFHDRPNGLRADLAQTIADIKPRFVRFPGGCLVHGDGLGNMYRWKDTIGPVEARRPQRNIWGYHQSVGLGFYEYFQFCEDIGAKPLPIVAAGVCCQNAGQTSGVGQRGIPMEQMPQYVQDVLDLIEWANGPATSTWGAKRAAAGHPAPFGLQYLGVGNEDRITPEFKERFKMIFDALKAKHPEITVVGTVGPFPKGEDFDEGWTIASELAVPIVDEHYYQSPDWFLSNLNRYDNYDRSKSKVYVGEYAAHERDRKTTLRTALAEAMYMTSLERNGDIVHMASYAPLLGKVGHTQWNPNLIYFTNTKVTPTINYYVQQMFGANQGDTYFAVKSDEIPQFAGSCVRDGKSGDVILKLVNFGDQGRSLHVDLTGASKIASTATKTVLSGDLNAVNNPDTPKPLVPQSQTMSIGNSFELQTPAHSLTVIRIGS